MNARWSPTLKLFDSFSCFDSSAFLPAFHSNFLILFTQPALFPNKIDTTYAITCNLILG